VNHSSGAAAQEEQHGLCRANPSAAQPKYADGGVEPHPPGAVAGQSAGAWIALMLCLNPRYLNALNLSPLDISGWIIDSAQTTSHFNVIKRERGENPLLQRIDEYAPLYYVDENTRFTRMLLMFYREDMPCRPEQNRLFARVVFTFNQNANIRLIELPGGHCHGSSVKDSDGQYPFVKETLKWLEHNS